MTTTEVNFTYSANLGQPTELDLEQTVFEHAPRFPSFDELQKYWYDTGPLRVLDGWIQMDNETQLSRKRLKITPYWSSEKVPPTTGTH